VTGTDDTLRIVRGRPTDEELAALVGVLLLSAAPAVPAAPPPSRWATSVRPAFTRRTAGWRASGLPR
jgi:hypothetical protein